MSSRITAPLIGLTPLWDRARLRYWMFPEYMDHICNAGGIPVILPICDEPERTEEILHMVNGVLFTGGPDIDPSVYGSVDRTGTVDVCKKRDAFEIPLMETARNLDIPTLCICRGIQLLNVVMGGTVYEDIQAQYPDGLQHMQNIPFSYPSHTVRIEKGTILHGIVKSNEIRVNSCHHQAIRRLADGLNVSARSSDGLIEAVEIPDRTFCIGVQWHPERLQENDKSSEAIFRAFVGACR